jgi:hypothetical protein
MKPLRKLFGKFDLTWKKLIIFAIAAGVYTALMALIPIFQDTSFHDIAVTFEWWIFFGIIIIVNSKNPKDSMLKCFVFFLISQPLVYLIQVPFAEMGWGLFGYYRYWFYWTLLTLPLGYFGKYLIDKKNFLSLIALMPMYAYLAFAAASFMLGTDKAPHILSGIWCILFIVLPTLGIFRKKLYIIVTLSISAVIFIATILLSKGIIEIGSSKEYIADYEVPGISLNETSLVVSNICTDGSGTSEIAQRDGKYIIKIKGHKNMKCKARIAPNTTDEDFGDTYTYNFTFNNDGKLEVTDFKEYEE